MPTKTYVPIAETTLSSASNTIVFNTISQSYTDLVIILRLKGTITTHQDVYMQFGNNGSFITSGYSGTYLGAGTTATTSRITSTSDFKLTRATGITSYTAGGYIVNIMSYSRSCYKSMLGQSNVIDTIYPGTEVYCGSWANTTAITDLKFYASQDFAIGSSVTIYGIAAA